MHKKLQLSALAVAASVFVIACSDPAAPTSTLTGDVAAAVVPHPIDFQGGGTYPPNSGLADGVVRLCKSANATGTFAFTYSVNGAQAQPIPGGGSLSVTTPGTPACVNIFVSSVDNNATPGYETVVITEAADQTNWALTDRTIDQYFGAFVTYPSPRLDDDDDAPDARSVTVYINNDMAKLATFTNTFTAPPSTGCTYTKGWYSNKNGNPTVTAVDGRTQEEAQTIMKSTPSPNPKQNLGVTWGSDNLLHNLYQQLLAAILNGGTSGPADVQQAITDALAGTDGTGLDITTTLTHDEMADLVETLSNFNEGTFEGWPHCDDN